MRRARFLCFFQGVLSAGGTPRAWIPRWELADWILQCDWGHSPLSPRDVRPARMALHVRRVIPIEGLVQFAFAPYPKMVFVITWKPPTPSHSSPALSSSCPDLLIYRLTHTQTNSDTYSHTNTYSYSYLLILRPAPTQTYSC